MTATSEFHRLVKACDTADAWPSAGVVVARAKEHLLHTQLQQQNYAQGRVAAGALPTRESQEGHWDRDRPRQTQHELLRKPGTPATVPRVTRTPAQRGSERKPG